MAKESMKAREVKRAKLVARYAAKRAALKEAGDYAGLAKLPKNSNPIRLHNRCQLTGRPKGYMRQFGISRIQFREMASAGLLPGVKKASWEIFDVVLVQRRNDLIVHRGFGNSGAPMLILGGIVTFNFGPRLP